MAHSFVRSPDVYDLRDAAAGRLPLKLSPGEPPPTRDLPPADVRGEVQPERNCRNHYNRPVSGSELHEGQLLRLVKNPARYCTRLREVLAGALIKETSYRL